MSSFLAEIEAYLVGKGLGVSGTDLFTGFMPEQPDACISLERYAGSPSMPGFGFAGVQHEMPGLHVEVRGTAEDYAGPEAKAEAIYRALAEIQGTELSGTPYLMALAQGAPFPLRRDEQQRVVFAMNFLIEKELSAA